MLAGLRLNLNRPLGVMLAPLGTPLPGRGRRQGFRSIARRRARSISPATVSPTIPPGSRALQQHQPQLALAGADSKARQLLARYLYVLAMVLHDSGTSVLPATLETGSQIPLDTRRLAQWAINAVCFETNDSIMVPFKYDPYILVTAAGGPQPNPGWQLTDDIINTNLTYGAVTADSVASFGVVWGCKPPELLLMETAAFHDRGVADTAVGPIVSTTAAARKFFGVRHGPQPLHLARSGRRPGAGAERLAAAQAPLPARAVEPGRPQRFVHVQRCLDPQTGKPYGWSLNLGQLAPSSTAGGALTGPVWRIVVSQSRFKDVPSGVDSKNDVSWRLSTYPDSSAIEPEQYVSDPYAEFSMLAYQTPVQSSGTAANVGMERVIWFTPTKPTGAVNNQRTCSCSFWNYDGVNNLPAPAATRFCPAAITWCWGQGPITTSAPGDHQHGQPQNANQCLSSRTTASRWATVTSGSTVFPHARHRREPDQDALQHGHRRPAPSSWPTHLRPVGISIPEPLYSGIKPLLCMRAADGPRPRRSDGMVRPFVGVDRVPQHAPGVDHELGLGRYRRHGDWKAAPLSPKAARPGPRQ